MLAELDDQAALPRPRRAIIVSAYAAGVLTQRIGVRREVGVLAEDVLGGHVGRELDEQARLADLHAQRIERLDLVELVEPEEALAQRRCAEIDQLESETNAAEPARVARSHMRLDGVPHGVTRRTAQH